MPRVPESRLTRWQRPAVALGCALFVVVWNRGFFADLGVGEFDWKKELFYFHYLQTALRDFGTWPFGMLAVPVEVVFAPAIRRSFSYWGNPEALALSPLLFLLPFVGAVVFIKLHLLMHWCAGAIGAFLLGARLGLSTAGSVALYALTLLNPWLMQHVAIGYLQWINVCLVPWIAWLWLAPRFGRGHVALCAGLLALVFYQGGVHVLAWTLGSAMLLAVVDSVARRRPDTLLRVATSLFAAAALMLPRLWAALRMPLGRTKRYVSESYASASDVLGLLTDARPDVLAPKLRAVKTYGTQFYDGSTYVGVPWLCLVAAALALLVWRVWRRRRAAPGQVGLLLLGLAALVAGWDGVWEAAACWLPVLEVERAPFRFLVVTVFAVTVFAVRELDGAVRGSRAGTAALVLAAALVVLPWAPRNAYFASEASKREPSSYGSIVTVAQNLREHVRATAPDGRAVDARATPNGVTIPAPGAEVLHLQWLAFDETGLLERFDFDRVPRPRQLRGRRLPTLDELLGAHDSTASFAYHNADVRRHGLERTVLRLVDPGAEVRIEARRHGALPLTGLALVLFAGVVAAVPRRGWREEAPTP